MCDMEHYTIEQRGLVNSIIKMVTSIRLHAQELHITTATVQHILTKDLHRTSTKFFRPAIHSEQSSPIGSLNNKK